MTKYLLQAALAPAVAGLLLLTGPAEGQQGQRNERSRTASEQRKITGTIKRTYRVRLPGTFAEARAVVLRTKQGKRILADLGLARYLRDVDLQSGERITLTGQMRRIEGRQIFVASRLQAEGRTISVSRRLPRQPGRYDLERAYDFQTQRYNDNNDVGVNGAYDYDIFEDEGVFDDDYSLDTYDYGVADEESGIYDEDGVYDQDYDIYDDEGVYNDDLYDTYDYGEDDVYDTYDYGEDDFYDTYDDSEEGHYETFGGYDDAGEEGLFDW